MTMTADDRPLELRSRKDVHQDIQLRVSKEEYEILNQVLDKLVILGKMTMGSLGQTFQPKYAAHNWKGPINKAISMGILQHRSCRVYLDSGRTNTIQWIELSPSYRYEPLRAD